MIKIIVSGGSEEANELASDICNKALRDCGIQVEYWTECSAADAKAAIKQGKSEKKQVVVIGMSN